MPAQIPVCATQLFILSATSHRRYAFSLLCIFCWKLSLIVSYTVLKQGRNSCPRLLKFRLIFQRFQYGLSLSDPQGPSALFSGCIIITTMHALRS